MEIRPEAYCPVGNCLYKRGHGGLHSFEDRPEVNPIVLWVIYDHPTDYPNDYVLRRWDGRINAPIDKGPPYARSESLDGLRTLLPSGVTNLGRQMHDDRAILEVWIYMPQLFSYPHFPV